MQITLLGSGNSGKSTILKQVKIIHQNGYTVDERASYRLTIYKNVIDCAKALVEAIQQFRVEVKIPKNKEHCEFLMEYEIDPDPTQVLNERVGDAIKSIWNDPCISEVLDHSNEFYLMDSAPYFFPEIERISSPGYLPTEADVLRARVRTTGIHETRFQMGQLSIHMFDISGLQNERKKWIHCFENVTSIVFCAAMNEYDHVVFDKSSENRMTETLVLFDSVVNSRWFMRSSIILFLNKMDLFRAKLPKSPLEKYFPNYRGGNDNYQAAKYFKRRFSQLNRTHVHLYIHMTQATDTANILDVFIAMKKNILHNALKDSSIL